MGGSKKLKERLQNLESFGLERGCSPKNGKNDLFGKNFPRRECLQAPTSGRNHPSKSASGMAILRSEMNAAWVLYAQKSIFNGFDLQSFTKE